MNIIIIIIIWNDTHNESKPHNELCLCDLDATKFGCNKICFNQTNKTKSVEDLRKSELYN